MNIAIKISEVRFDVKESSYIFNSLKIMKIKYFDRVHTHLLRSDSLDLIPITGRSLQTINLF